VQQQDFYQHPEDVARWEQALLDLDEAILLSIVEKYHFRGWLAPYGPENFWSLVHYSRADWRGFPIGGAFQWKSASRASAGCLSTASTASMPMSTTLSVTAIRVLLAPSDHGLPTIESAHFRPDARLT
jgi:hypothetical protein